MARRGGGVNLIFRTARIRLTHGRRHDRHMPVVGMIEAHHDITGATAEGRDLGRREGEADELHRRGLAVVARAFLVALGYAADDRAADTDEGLVLDAAQHG